jgi:hypothetical protein
LKVWLYFQSYLGDQIFKIAFIKDDDSAFFIHAPSRLVCTVTEVMTGQVKTMTGAIVTYVPPYIQPGDRINVNPETGKFCSRSSETPTGCIRDD